MNQGTHSLISHACLAVLLKIRSIRKVLRPVYVHDPADLIELLGVKVQQVAVSRVAGEGGAVEGDGGVVDTLHHAIMLLPDVVVL